MRFNVNASVEGSWDEKEILMKILNGIVLAAMVSAAPAAFAQEKMSAQEFATTAASSDMFEINSSKVALEKSSNNDIKEFAQTMIDDHTKASEELKEAASRGNVTVPAEMLPKHASDLEALNNAPAEGFDQTYVSAQVKAHEEAVALMNNYSENGDNEALKAHAQKTAPVIESHLQHVKEMQSGM